MGLVTIKSYHSGLSLLLDPNADFSYILEEIGSKFEDSRKFFRNANIALSIDGRVLNSEEEKAVIRTINEHSDVNIFCIIGKDEETERRYVKALKRVEMQNNLNNARYYEGDVYEDDILEAEGTLIVAGDVHKGAVVSATGNVIVLGDMEGMGMCGPNRSDCNNYFAALNMQPERITVGGMVYKGGKTKTGFGRKNKANGLIVAVRNNKIVTSEFNLESARDLIFRNA